jgi:hypothetical protein
MLIIFTVLLLLCKQLGQEKDVDGYVIYNYN